VSLLALGGYGRCLLNPFSDVDVMVLYGDGSSRPEDDPRLALMIQLLWDLGFQVGQSCRSLEDCKAAMRDSLETATSFFDARLICGDEGLFQTLRRRVLAEYLARKKTEFTQACLKALRARHERFSHSPFCIEPHVKEGPGGLRDAQVMSWLQRIQGHAPLRSYHFIAGEWPEAMREAHDFLLRVRTAMHIHDGRANDLLDLGTQRVIAEKLGYAEVGGFSPVELFMRDYYRSAAAIYREVRYEMQRAEHSALSGTVDLRGRWRRNLGDGLVATSGRLYIVDRNFFASADAPRRLMNLFVVAQNTQLEASQAALKEIQGHLSMVDDAFRMEPKAARLFLDVFGGQGNVASTLRAMHECGLLDEYIPEFGALNCLVWYRNYHDYTVDEHSLNAVAVLDELRRSQRKEDEFKRAILLGIEQPYLLFLGVLLHDIGKSVSGDHAENGATMVPLIAERLGLSESEASLLYFLVADHLRMIHTAQSRDIREDAVAADFATAVGSLNHLKALYLLTYADTKAIGRTAWTQWQDTLLQELYERTAIVLSKEPTEAVKAPRLLERMKPFLSTPGLLKAAEEHCALVPERYLIEVEPEDAVEHLRLVEELRSRTAAVSMRAERDLTRLWISTTDRPARFSQLAGALSGSGVDIVSAQAYTRKDGIIFDRFEVVDVHGKSIRDPEFQQKVRENLFAVLEGRVTVQDLIRRQQRRVAFKRVIPQPGATRIVLENKSSPHYTVVDVATWDRIGLLYAISSSISALGLDIHFAKIATKANRAADVFYVTDKNTGKKIWDEHRQRLIERKLFETCETFGA
jgi:[protein-PII] uridylyltransferase